MRSQVSTLAVADAERALFIDFECLERRPPKSPLPALLGVLVGSDGEELEQLITVYRDGDARPLPV
jgi:hypothetical protein